MKDYRTALMRKEFPFLTEIVWSLYRSDRDLSHIDKINIRRGDASLLQKKGEYSSYDSSAGSMEEYTFYFAVWHDADGVLKVMKLKSRGQSATGSGDRSEWDANPIGDQLYGLGIVPDFIVECIKKDTDCNGNGQSWTHWTIHKMSRFDLLSYHQQQIDQAAAELKAEIAVACA